MLECEFETGLDPETECTVHAITKRLDGEQFCFLWMNTVSSL